VIRSRGGGKRGTGVSGEKEDGRKGKEREQSRGSHLAMQGGKGLGGTKLERLLTKGRLKLKEREKGGTRIEGGDRIKQTVLREEGGKVSD